MKLSENYLNNENEIRLTNNDNIKEYMNEIEIIKRKLKNNESIFYEHLKSIPLLKNISLEIEKENNEQGQAIEYLNLFFEDYILIFLSNNFNLSDNELYNKDLINNFIKIIKFLSKTRFEDYDEKVKADILLVNISKYILWIESNSKYIIIILTIYQKLSFIELLNDKIKKIIKNKEIKYEFGTKRSPSETRHVNECFFLLIESMIKLILK